MLNLNFNYSDEFLEKFINKPVWQHHSHLETFLRNVQRMNDEVYKYVYDRKGVRGSWLDFDWDPITIIERIFCRCHHIIEEIRAFKIDSCVYGLSNNYFSYFFIINCVLRTKKNRTLQHMIFK